MATQKVNRFVWVSQLGVFLLLVLSVWEHMELVVVGAHASTSSKLSKPSSTQANTSNSNTTNTLPKVKVQKLKSTHNLESLKPFLKMSNNGHINNFKGDNSQPAIYSYMNKYLLDPISIPSSLKNVANNVVKIKDKRENRPIILVRESHKIHGGNVETITKTEINKNSNQYQENRNAKIDYYSPGKHESKESAMGITSKPNVNRFVINRGNYHKKNMIVKETFQKNRSNGGMQDVKMLLGDEPRMSKEKELSSEEKKLLSNLSRKGDNSQNKILKNRYNDYHKQKNDKSGFNESLARVKLILNHQNPFVKGNGVFARS